MQNMRKRPRYQRKGSIVIMSNGPSKIDNMVPGIHYVAKLPPKNNVFSMEMAERRCPKNCSELEK